MAFPDNLYELIVGVILPPFLFVGIAYFIFLILNEWRLSYYEGYGTEKLTYLILILIVIVAILGIYFKYNSSNYEREQKKLNKKKEIFEKDHYAKAYADVKKMNINKRKILSQVYNIENDEIESIASFLSANCKFEDYNKIIELFTDYPEEDISSWLDWSPYLYIPNGIQGNDGIKKKCPECGGTMFLHLKIPIKEGGKITKDNLIFECKNQNHPQSFKDLAEKYNINDE